MDDQELDDTEFDDADDFNEPDIAEMYLLDSWIDNGRPQGVFLLRWASRTTYELEILNPDAWAGRFSVPSEALLEIAEEEAACVFFALTNAPLLKRKGLTREEAGAKASKRNWREYAAFHGRILDEVTLHFLGDAGAN